MILSISEAAKKRGIGRSTLYAMRKNGNLGIDTSELDRVFSDKTSTASSLKTHQDQARHDLSLLAMEKEDEGFLRQILMFWEVVFIQRARALLVIFFL